MKTLKNVFSQCYMWFEPLNCLKIIENGKIIILKSFGVLLNFIYRACNPCPFRACGLHTGTNISQTHILGGPRVK